MTKVAIVCAAGYKGVGWGFPDVPLVCPESLLPIGEQYGGTPVARICTQLNKLGWKSFVTVGQPGSRYTKILNKASRNTESHFPVEALAEADKPPWTYERLRYIAQYGIPLLMADPDYKCAEDSILQAIDFIGTDWWDTLVTLYCDHIWTDEGLRDLLMIEPPCQPIIPERQYLVIHTPETARLYRQLIDKHRARAQNPSMPSNRRWGKGNRLPPAGLEFEKHAPYRTVLSSAACSKDLDTPQMYRYVRDVWLPTNG